MAEYGGDQVYPETTPPQMFSVIRERYPEYSNVTDEDLDLRMRTVHAEKYSNIPYEEFLERAERARAGPQELLFQGVTGFNRAIAQFADAPGRVGHAIMEPVVRKGAQALGYGEEEVPPPESLVGQGIRALTPNRLPATPGQRIARHTGHTLGAAAPYTLLGPGAAMTTSRAAAAPQGGLTVLDAIRRGIALPYIQQPVQTMVTEGLAAAGAGFAGGLADEKNVDPMWKGLIEIPAGLAAAAAGQYGPTAAKYMPAALIYRGLKTAYQAARHPTKAREILAGTEDELGEVIKHETEQAVSAVAGKALEAPQSQAALRESEEVARALKEGGGVDFNPSLAQRTGSKSLIRTQEEFEQHASGPLLEELAERQAKNEMSIGFFEESVAPHAQSTPQHIFDVARDRINAVGARIQKDLDAVTVKRQAAGTVTKIDKERVGGEIRRDILEAKKEKSKEMDVAAQEIGVSNSDISEPFLKLADDLVDNQMAFFDEATDMPDVYRYIDKQRTKIRNAQEAHARSVEEATRGGREPPAMPPEAEEPVMTFADLKRLRERVSDDLLDEQRSANPKRRRMRSLIAARKMVDDVIDDLAESSVDPGIAQRYKDFRDIYYTQYIQIYEKGAVYKIQKKGDRSFYRTEDEDVAAAFWGDGKVGPLRHYKKIFPEETQAMQDTIVDDFRRVAVRNGIIDEKAAETWFRRNEDALNEYPLLRAKLTARKTLNEELARRQIRLQAREKLLDRTIMAQLLRSRDTPEIVLRKGVANYNIMQAIYNRIKHDPEAVRVAQKLVWDEARNLSGADLANWMKASKKSLDILYKKAPEHLDNLGIIQRARAMLESTTPIRGAGFDPTQVGWRARIEQFAGRSIPSIGGRIYAFHSGRVQKGYLVLDTLGASLVGRQRAQFETVMHAALYDQNLAKLIARDIKTKTLRPDTLRQVNAFLFTIGSSPEE